MAKLFDYSKPGRGVHKDHSEKRPYIQFWELFGRKFWSIFELGFWYFLLCIPLLTIGLSKAGATFITRNFVREKPVFLISDFFKTIKKNWKQALPAGIINTIATVIMLYSAYFYFMYGNFTGILLMCMVLLLLLFFTVMQYYLYIMMVTFNYKFFQLYKNAFYMAFLGIKSNLLIIGTSFLVFGFYISLTLTFFLQPVAVLQGIGSLFATFGIIFLPAFRFLLIQFFVFPVIKKHLIDPYYEKNPEEFESVRHFLNLENEESKKQDEEKAIFHETEFNEENNKNDVKSSIPKQYSQDELRSKRSNNDDDDTI